MSNREAEFEEVDIRRVPARLIHRDPETQVVVTRNRAMEGRWRELDLRPCGAPPPTLGGALARVA